jgi:hypothetical protein
MKNETITAKIKKRPAESRNKGGHHRKDPSIRPKASGHT